MENDRMSGGAWMRRAGDASDVDHQGEEGTKHDPQNDSEIDRRIELLTLKNKNL
jgi:hypothetical protein